MAFAIPIIAAFASGAVGAVVAGTAGFAAYASVAGAVLSGVGALTGKKDLTRLGAVLSIGGGIASAFGGGASAVAETGMGIGSIGAEQMGAQAIEQAAAAGVADAAPSLAGDFATAATTTEPDLTQLGAFGEDAAGSLYGQNAASQASLSQQYGTAPNVQAQPVASVVEPMQATAPIQPVAADPMAAVTQQPSALQNAASQFTGDQVQSWYDKAVASMKGAATGIGKFAQQNPELLKMGGNMLSSMYGPQAERMDYEKSLMERARANINAPIRLKYTPGG